MTKRRLTAVAAIFQAVVDLPPEERQRVLSERCGDDAELRAYVERMLANHDRGIGDFLETPARHATTPGDPDEPDLTLHIGHYEILRKLGEGGMGVVFEAEDLKLRRSVALKFLSPTALGSEGSRRRFIREARMAASLNHPSICTVYEVGEVDASSGQTIGDHLLPSGTPFIAMERIAGRTLAQEIESVGPLPLSTLLDLATQVAEGLAAAHARGVVHRDLKPRNVMVTAEGRVKILDFGLAKPTPATPNGTHPANAEETASTGQTHTHQTLEGMIVGTVGYMSPEQAAGDPVDSRSDVFSFGIMLYEMSTGRRPFREDTATGTLQQILEADPEPPSTIRDDLPAELERIISRCLRKRPDNRFNDTRDLVVAMKDLREESSSGSARVARPRPAESGRRVAEHGATVSRPTGRWILSRRGALPIAIVLAGLLVILGVWGLGHRRSAPALPFHRKVTSSGKASYPAISPDGRSVAYVQEDVPGEKRILVRDVGTGGPLEIFRGADIWELQWSPTGVELLFGITTDEGWAAHIIPRLGGAPQRFPGFECLAWSPDGRGFAGGSSAKRSIFFTDRATGDTASVALSGSFVWIMSLDWAPGGRLLAFVTRDEDEHSTIWTITRDGSRQLKVVDADSGLHSPRFSPDGRYIYYLHKSEHTSDFRRIRIDLQSGAPRGDPEQVLVAPQAGEHFALSAVGNTLVTVRSMDCANLWVVKLGTDTAEDGYIDTRQLTSGSARSWRPSFSPDGRLIAFGRGNERVSEIFTIPVEGGSPQQVTFLEADSDNPAWSPDGQEIAFASNQGGEMHVWRVSLQGGPPSPFRRTRLSGNSYQLAWAPGSSILYHLPGHRDFSLLDPLSEEEVRLTETESDGWMFEPRFSPDGTRVAVHWNRGGEHGVWVISLEDRAKLQAYDDWARPVGWSRDGTWIYALTSRLDAPGLLRIPVAGGPAEPVARLPFDQIDGRATISPDGTTLVCSVIEDRADVWLVENFDPDAR